MAETNPDILRCILDGYHGCAVAAALLGPHPAAAGDGFGVLLALAGLAFGHRRPAATLTVTSAVSALASTLLH